MKKIAFVLERLGNGGAERVTAALATEFSINYGYEVHIFTCVREENEYDVPSCVVRHVMSSDKKSRIGQIFCKCDFLHREIKKINTDVVFSLATPKTTILLCFLSLIRKYRLVVSERNDPNSYPKNPLLKKLRNIAYGTADGVVFQTEDAKAYFCDTIQKKSTVIPNPVSDSLPEPFVGVRKKKIVNYCRLEPQKNLLLLINSMIEVHDDYPDYELEIFGDGSQEEALKEYCSAHGANEYIHFMGFERDIHKKISDASLFVSSSNYEGISNSMLEAIAIGIPTISTDCPIGGARMVIEDHKNGILVPVNDQEKMVKAIKEVLSSDRLSHELSANGIQLREKFSVSTIAKSWSYYVEGSGENEDN